MRNEIKATNASQYELKKCKLKCVKKKNYYKVSVREAFSVSKSTYRLLENAKKKYCERIKNELCNLQEAIKIHFEKNNKINLHNIFFYEFLLIFDWLDLIASSEFKSFLTYWLRFSKFFFDFDLIFCNTQKLF